MTDILEALKESIPRKRKYKMTMVVDSSSRMKRKN